MSIRVVLCVLLALYFSVYAWRNYFVSLCVAILLMAIMQHPDVIANLKDIGGIQGLNLWNLLMFNVTLAWWVRRRSEGLDWDMPRPVRNLLAAYVVVIIWSGLRLLSHMPYGYTFGGILSEDFIDCLKWMLPTVILYDCCRDRRRIVLGAIMILALYLLLALQVIKHVPPSAAISEDFDHIAYKMIQNSVGYNRVTLSMMLAGASWAMLAFLPVARTKRQQYMLCAAAGATALGQALTGGRSGYVGWMAVGVILGAVRWRRMLLLIPVALAVICAFLPAVRDRMMQGIGMGESKNNVYEMTSGRNIAWPYVIDKIKESPVFGFGREAMISTGIYQKILNDTNNGESFPHPHNAYLQILLDCGVVGFVCVMPFYVLVLRRAFALFLDRGDPLYGAMGGMVCALVLALLVAALGGETFYPREGSVGMWAAIGLMLRVSVERDRARGENAPLFGDPVASDGALGADVSATEITA